MYKPHHPWRHGYRREKIGKLIMVLVKVLFVLEVFALAGRYVKEHMEVRVTEREVTDIPMEENGEVFGIGIGSEDGKVFWFHKSREKF